MATRRPPAMPGAHLIREAEAISAGAAAAFLALSFLSYAPDTPHANLGGPVGHALAGGALRAAIVARVRGVPLATAPSPRPPKTTKAPILLDDALDESHEPESGSPPPIIREPERRAETGKRPKRAELQEELFAEDTYRLPALTLLDEAVRT